MRETVKDDGAAPERRPQTSMRDRARLLRREAGQAESRLWSRLRGHRLGVKFRRQHPVGSFVATFFCHQAGLVVEIDRGGHQRDGQRAADELRIRHFEQRGYRVLPLPEEAVLSNMEAALRRIRESLTLTRSA